MLIMPYDTGSQSRNVLASPLGEEGHEVAKGWTVVILIMILDVDVTAERRHYNTHRPLMGSLCITSIGGPPIGGQDRDGASYQRSALYTLCLFEAFPSRGNEKYGEKNRASYTSCTIPVCPPLVAGATTFPPQAGALWMLSHGVMSLQESIERPILPPEQGWQGNTIRKEAKRPENRVIRFPVEKSGTAG